MLAQRRPKEPQDKDWKVSDPDPFKGDPEDLERFLLQITNKFIMEPRRFLDDVRKVRFAGQLMKDRAYKWYRAYHLQISSRDATRIRGDIELDPQYASWDRFEASLRATFGERITRKEAVREWERLRHTTSIDDFVDEITRLMWVTGFEGQQVEDKIERGLNDVMHLEWAKLPNKPYGIAEQLALLRDIGHSIEDAMRSDTKRYKMMGGQNQKTKKEEGQSQNQGQPKGAGPKGKGKGKGKGPQEKTSGKLLTSKEWKERDEHLKGISKEILEERKQAKVCQKCGKGTHKWFECCTKTPVTSKVVACTKRGRDDDGPKTGAKKAKTAVVKNEEKPAVVAGVQILGEIHGSEEDFDVWAV